MAQDGFSLNRAARELNGIVSDVTCLRRGAVSELSNAEAWQDDARSTVALELAAANLRQPVSAPVMPRFAGRLAAALGRQTTDQRPASVEFLPAGSQIELARKVFFGQPSRLRPMKQYRLKQYRLKQYRAISTEATSTLLPWLSSMVAEVAAAARATARPSRSLALPEMTSMQSIALQYQIMDRTGLDVSIEELLGERTVARAGQLPSGQQCRSSRLANLTEVATR